MGTPTWPELTEGNPEFDESELIGDGSGQYTGFWHFFDSGEGKGTCDGQGSSRSDGYGQGCIMGAGTMAGDSIPHRTNLDAPQFPPAPDPFHRIARTCT